MMPSPGQSLRQSWWLPPLCCGLAWWLAGTAPLQLAEWRTLDWRTVQRARFQPPPDPRLAIILFEDNSEANIGAWPVDRAWHGRMNRLLAAERAAVVTWDVFFDVARAGEGDGELVREIRAAARTGTRIVVGAPTSPLPAADRPGGTDLTRPITRVEGDRASIHGNDHALLPFPALRAVAWWGAVDAPRTADGLIRELPLLVRVGDGVYPSLSLQTLMAYLGVPAEQVRARLGDAVHLTTPERTWRIPIDRHGGFLVNYRYDQAGNRPDLPTYAYLGLMVQLNDAQATRAPGAAPAPLLADKIVFVGQTVTGKADVGPTPFGPASPLVLVHANALHNMLAGDYARRVPATAAWGLVLLLAYGSLAGLTHRPVVVLGAGGAAVVGGYAAAAVLLWIGGSWWLPLVGPLLALGAVQFAVLGRRVRDEQRRRLEIKAMFGTYVAPRVVERLVAAGEPPRLGGITTEVTAYFSDIAGFSGFSESLPPERLVELMNEYLTACTDVVHEEGGTLDKYVGDAVVAMFGAPVPLADHACRATVAAVRVQRRLGELRERWARAGTDWPPAVRTMRTRIGLNTGRCVVGNMGSRTRFNYTMMGDEVNLASRLESAASRWGVAVLCSDATRAACERHGGDRVVFRPLGRVVVAGRTHPVAIHEVVGLRADLPAGALEGLALFDEGLARYHARDWAGAGAWFERSAALESPPPGGPAGAVRRPSHVFRELAAGFARQPPPPDWDGVHLMTEK